MLTITLIALVLAIPLSSASDTLPLFSKRGTVTATISATLYTRIVAIALLFAAVLSYNMFPAVASSSGSLGLSPLREEAVDSLSILDAGVGLYSGLIHTTTVTLTIEVFLLIAGAAILLPWSHSYGYDIQTSIVVAPKTRENGFNRYSGGGNPLPPFSQGGGGGAGEGFPGETSWPTIPEYPMIILFTTLGATFLASSADLVSIYLSIELQSFGVYILAAIYRDSESATAAGLKYFLLGALSSALILLGSSLVYGYTGTTGLNSIYELLSVPSLGEEGFGLDGGNSYSQVIILGFILISVGLLFKVASAPFHYWAPDVYDGTPTIVTTWLTVMPKISIFIFLLELYRGTGAVSFPHSIEMSTFDFSSITITTSLLLICAFLSLVIGTVVGLGQYRIKRLLAYSTISHVGFILLALSVGSASTIAGEESVEAFLFYIIQYTITNIDAFFVLLALGYCINNNGEGIHLFPMGGTAPKGGSKDIAFTSELVGSFIHYPVLGLSFAICLFSMAGVPPLIGFFAKYTVLYSAIHNGYIWLSVIAILASVVSAVYYLRIIRVIHFDIPATGKNHSLLQGGDTEENKNKTAVIITSVHSYIISFLTLFILLFAVNPILILNSTSIMALSMYIT